MSGGVGVVTVVFLIIIHNNEQDTETLMKFRGFFSKWIYLGGRGGGRGWEGDVTMLGKYSENSLAMSNKNYNWCASDLFLPHPCVHIFCQKLIPLVRAILDTLTFHTMVGWREKKTVRQRNQTAKYKKIANWSMYQKLFSNNILRRQWEKKMLHTILFFNVWAKMFSKKLWRRKDC